MNFFNKLIALFILSISFYACIQQGRSAIVEEKKTLTKKNIIFILSDDHRYDFMSFMNKVPFLETPNMDMMASQGAHIQNAFVSTSLCSPSRASILTGQYAHRHGVIDNQSLVPKGTVFFPSYLQKNGYKTGYIGKWHMGEHHDDPRPGFDYWASFKGQGTYYNPKINLNGKRVNYTDSSYTSDVLTDYALDFLKAQDKDQPYFLYLSHKAVHAKFYPSPRHRGKYAEKPVSYPPSMYPPGHDLATTDTITYGRNRDLSPFLAFLFR